MTRQEVIQWLLEESNPAISYRTMTELLHMEKEDIEVKKAYDRLLKSDSFRQAMSKFDLNDKWEDINAFLTLAEMGVSKKNIGMNAGTETGIYAEIDLYVERVIKRMNKSTKCARMLLVRNLVMLGYLKHPWVQQQLEEGFETIRENGSVRCLDAGKKRNDSRLPEMGCYRQTTTYLLLAAELIKNGVILPEFEQIKLFYLNHEVCFHSEEEMSAMKTGRASKPEFGIIPEMMRCFYPPDHTHIGIQQILYALSVLGVAKQKECEKAWNILELQRNEDGRYVLEDSFPEPYFEVGHVGEPNKWVTLYVFLAT